MPVTRGYRLINSNDDIIYSSSQPKLIRSWFKTNKSNLPNGRYRIVRVFRTFLENQPNIRSDRNDRWKTKILNVNN